VYRDPGQRPVEKLRRRTPLVLRVMAFLAGATLTLVFGGGAATMLVAMIPGWSHGHVNPFEAALQLGIIAFLAVVALYGVDLMVRAVTVRSTDAPAMLQKRYGGLRIVGALFVGGVLAAWALFFLLRSGDSAAKVYLAGALVVGSALLGAAVRAIAIRMKANDAADAVRRVAAESAVPNLPTRVASPPSLHEEDDAEVAAQRRPLRRLDE
jgi:hypothetical protein